jgi:hypothetical protein
VRSGSDVYLGVRSVAGKVKLSLHQDGRAQISLTSEHYSRLSNEGVPTPPSRHFARWRMPDVPDAGAVHVASVVFPSRYLRPWPPLQLSKPVSWEPAPERGALAVGLFYGRQLTRPEPPTRLRFATRLSDGRFVMIAVRNVVDFDDSQAVDRLSSPHEEYVLSDELRNARPGEVIADCAAIVWSDVQDGQAVSLWEITDLSVHRN